MRSELPSEMAGPSQLRFQPGQQFLQRERFHQIIVGAAAQALDTILQAAACGKHQDGNWIVAVPQLTQQLQAVAVRQPEVQDQARVERGSKDRACFLQRRKHVGLVAGRLQALAQELGKLLVVLDDQQSHISPPDGPIALAMRRFRAPRKYLAVPRKHAHFGGTRGFPGAESPWGPQATGMGEKPGQSCWNQAISATNPLICS